MNEPTTNTADARRKDEILLALRKASREAWELDDRLRQMCVDQARDALSSETTSQRDKQSAAGFVLKLSEFNLERTLMMAEITALVGPYEPDEPIALVSNKNFFRNDAHETVKPADQEVPDAAQRAADDRGSFGAAAPGPDFA